MSLSLCLIVRNEAELLPRCLNSVADLATELIVVDTGSTDETVAIAIQAGARIFELPWPGDFSLARNYALAQARCEWILMLDADEYLDQAAREVLRQFLAEPPEPARFWLRVCNLDTSGQMTDVYFVEKLFANRSTIRYVAPIHEFLVDISQPPTPELPLADLDIQHSGLLPGRIQALNKLVRNRVILEAALVRFPDEAHSVYHLANVCKDMGEITLALKYYARALQAFPQLPGTDHPFFALAACEAIACLIQTGRSPEALQLVFQTESACAHYPDYWLLRGQLLRREWPDQARLCFWHCLQIDHKTLMIPYRLAALQTLPLLQLLQLNRLLCYHPARSAEQKQAACHELQDVLLRLLRRWPEGEFAGLCQNLHLILAESVIQEADPCLAYQQKLPEALRVLLVVRQISDILNFLQNPSQFHAGLVDFSVEGLSLEAESGDPAHLSLLAQQWWQAGEKRRAQCLLHLGMLRLQQHAFGLELAELLQRDGRPNQAHQILLEARMIFPASDLAFPG